MEKDWYSTMGIVPCESRTKAFGAFGMMHFASPARKQGIISHDALNIHQENLSPADTHSSPQTHGRVLFSDGNYHFRYPSFGERITPTHSARVLMLISSLEVAACGGSGGPGTPTSPAGPTPLSITSVVPSQALPSGTTQAEVGVDTSIDALCKGDKANVPYDQMSTFLSTSPVKIHRTQLSGLSSEVTPYFVVCITQDRSQTTNRQISVQVQISPTDVLARGAIRDLHTGASVSGNLTVNGKQFNLADGAYSITRDSGLSVGQIYDASINATGYIQRELKGVLTSGGLEVDLGGGRKENPLTVYRESTTFNLAEYINFCLRSTGSERIESPLKFAIFDTHVYRASNGSFADAGEIAMRPDSKDNLIQTIRQDAHFWTSSQIYTPETVESFIKLQSRGDELPDISKNGPYWPGWLVVVPRVDLPQDLLILMSNNGYLNGGHITAGLMAFQPNQAVQYINWTRDMREVFGISEIRDTLRNERAPYVSVLFNRPVGHTAPDTKK